MHGPSLKKYVFLSMIFLHRKAFYQHFLWISQKTYFFINQGYMLQYHKASEVLNKSYIPGHGYFAKLELFENNHCEKGDLFIEYRKSAFKEKSSEPCDFCKRTRLSALNPNQHHDHIPTTLGSPNSATFLYYRFQRMIVHRTIFSLERRSKGNSKQAN